jgi:hypothetical protein
MKFSDSFRMVEGDPKTGVSTGGGVRFFHPDDIGFGSLGDDGIFAEVAEFRRDFQSFFGALNGFKKTIIFSTHPDSGDGPFQIGDADVAGMILTPRLYDFGRSRRIGLEIGVGLNRK